MDKSDLQDLIAKINTKENLADSRETIRWKALREAETLEDADIFPMLREIITKNEGKGKAKREIRSAAYFIYGKLFKKTFRVEDCTFFIQRLNKENDKYSLTAILDRIKDLKYSNILLPPQVDIAPILSLTRNDNHHVRHGAILALSVCPGEESRKALAFYLAKEDEKAYQYEIYYANIAMQTIGKPEDIPLLERSLKSRRPDLKITAQYAIQYIQEREMSDSVNH